MFALAEAGGAAADDAGVGMPCEGLGDPDFGLEHPDNPRLRMAGVGCERVRGHDSPGWGVVDEA